MTSDTMTQEEFQAMFGGGTPAPPAKRRQTVAGSQAELIQRQPELFQQQETKRAEVLP